VLGEVGIVAVTHILFQDTNILSFSQKGNGNLKGDTMIVI
jgi:hypothetical protein